MKKARRERRSAADMPLPLPPAPSPRVAWLLVRARGIYSPGNAFLFCLLVVFAWLSVQRYELYHYASRHVEAAHPVFAWSTEWMSSLRTDPDAIFYRWQVHLFALFHLGTLLVVIFRSVQRAWTRSWLPDELRVLPYPTIDLIFATEDLPVYKLLAVQAVLLLSLNILPSRDHSEVWFFWERFVDGWIVDLVLLPSWVATLLIHLCLPLWVLLIYLLLSSSNPDSLSESLLLLLTPFVMIALLFACFAIPFERLVPPPEASARLEATYPQGLRRKPFSLPIVDVPPPAVPPPDLADVS